MGSIVLYPAPGMGHLISMVELGKLIVNHHPSFSITILTTTPSFNTGSTASYIRHITNTTPSITFHHLPIISLDPQNYPSVEAITFSLLTLNNPHVHQALRSISLSSTKTILIIDLFCTPALPIATDLKIPVYYFFTSGASCLALFLHFPSIHQKTNKSFKDMKTLLHIPSLPPLLSSDMPVPILDRTSKDYECFLHFCSQLPKSAGTICNTFQALEPQSMKEITNGLGLSLFCIGPLIAELKQREDEDVHVPQCLKWLNTQPSKSVVFLCFGSLGLFSCEQIKEIAIGLERSEHRFLWVVRSPPSEYQTKRFLPPNEPDLDLLLPQGFLERTKERGLVVKSWAPQVDVLSHGSVGGFVTHCGWNSVLEAVWTGVPMVAWPLYAEQRFNSVVLVEDMKLALKVNEEEDGFVRAVEVEKRVRELMELEEGELVRERVKVKREEARLAMGDRGSSQVALANLIHAWKVGCV